MKPSTLGLFATLSCPAIACLDASGSPDVQFVDATSALGVQHEHRLTGATALTAMSGGLAAGDFDDDGYVDLFVVGGDDGRDVLLRNERGARFSEVAGGELGPERALHNGAVWADYDGDGNLDLFVGGLSLTPPKLYRNLGERGFSDATAEAGLAFDDVENANTFSAAFGDYDGDGVLDLAVAHWNEQRINRGSSQHLWRNQGDGTFADVSEACGLSAMFQGSLDFTFTPNFADINADGRADLLFASDFGTSQVLLNEADGTFEDVSDSVINDENGMGAAIGDYDNDGHLDWFVTGIYRSTDDPLYSIGSSGNRLYRGLGDGTFEDRTDEAGVRDGGWGWASCFQDFDNDGHLDIFHVNGVDSGPHTESFSRDRSRLFISNGDGTFREAAAAAGVDGTLVGVGVACFDFDRDGDVDIAVANNRGPLTLYRNESEPDHHFLSIQLRGPAPNTRAIGARITLDADGQSQLRELRAGSNYLSSDPAEAHFGLGRIDKAERLVIAWPDGAESVLRDVAADRHLVVSHPTVGHDVAELDLDK